MAALRSLSRTVFCAVLLAGMAFDAAALTIQGTVFDPSRKPVAGARLSARSNRRDAAQSAISGPDGTFSLDLEPGEYVLRIQAPGFADASRSIQAGGAAVIPLEIVLEIARAHDTVVVTEPVDYQVPEVSSGTRTLTPLRDIPQAVTVVSWEQMQDQLMMSIGDVVRYIPGITAVQGENNRDQVVIRGNNSSADFFVNGVRDDVQYYRDLYNLDRVEALKGPNALMFGRGGGGGVLNRVTKEPLFTPLREVTLTGGSFGARRISTDLDQPLNGKMALRFNGMYENSDSFRDSVSLKRFGLNPTLTIAPSSRTTIVLGYERFRDDRVADRGIPSFQGRPVDVPVSTYYGDPSQSHVGARVNLGTVAIKHQWGSVTLQNRLMIGDYDRGYQNFVPGAVNAGGTQVALSAYNNATQRRNIFNQSDLTYMRSTGKIHHTLAAGVEVGHQSTGNFRNTGYFNNTDTSIQIPYASPLISAPITFRQSATDADNHVTTDVAAAYVQDQIDLSRRLQLIAGLRFDRFDLRFHNNRTGDDLQRIDNLRSPRGGIVFKPIAPVSVYGSYTISWLPSSGDQFSSLTTITQQVKPEKFTNYEAGLKWETGRRLLLTMAAFRLDRTNTRSTDPNDPTRIVQTGSQRTNGYEFGVNGSITRQWKLVGGYAWQDAFITSDTTAARAGAQVAQTPHHTFSLWNRYQIRRRVSAGLGLVHRADMFAAVDNTVTLPAYTRLDAAIFISLTERTRLQLNAENLAGARYYLNADSNTNISPGAPRSLRVALNTRF
jgi:catecholate siderophore receptor